MLLGYGQRRRYSLPVRHIGMSSFPEVIGPVGAKLCRFTRDISTGKKLEKGVGRVLAFKS
jgi:hypothetical protein